VDPSPSRDPDADYEGKDAMHTLSRAHEITANVRLFGRAKKHAKRTIAQLKPVAAGKPLGKR